MDRPIVYPGALPQDTDLLTGFKATMMADGYLAQAILGTATAVDGCVATPTTPTADLHVHVSNGSIYVIDTVDQNAYGSLGTDVTTVYKQGINSAADTVFTITPPSTTGQSQVYLIQAEIQDLDTGPTVLSYYNASNPASPFAGPANAGTSQNTLRKANCLLSLKAGVAATTGSQVTPSPDAGFVGLWAVTVANGQTQITSANIVAYSASPAIPVKLPAVPAGVQSAKWIYAADTSTGGPALATTASTATSSAVLTFSSVPSWVTVGMKAFDLTTVGGITGGQTVASKTSTTVTLSGNVNATVSSSDSIAFSSNALVANISPVPASLVPGMEVRIQAAGTISGASTLNLNGFGATAIHRANGANTAAGDITVNEVVGLIYDGAAWQIKNYTGGAGGSVGGSTGIPYGTDASTASNTITVAPSPSISSLAAGQPLIVKLANPITGATAMTITGTGGPYNVISFTGQPLSYGSGSSGEMLWLLFDGTNFQIINPPQPLQQNLTIYVSASIGNDSFDGSQATISGTKGPLRHIQTAVTRAFNYPPSGSFGITIQVADGTYNEATSMGPTPGPSITINGNNTTPSNVLVTGANNVHTFVVNGPNNLLVQNLKATTGTGQGPPCAFIAGYGALLQTNNTVSGAVTYSVFEAFLGGSLIVGNHTFAGNAAYAFSALSGPISFSNNAVFTISGVVTFTAFAVAVDCGVISVSAAFPPSFVNPGNFTGQKYYASVNGIINTSGQGINFFPGNTAGTASIGGQYV